MSYYWISQFIQLSVFVLPASEFYIGCQARMVYNTETRHILVRAICPYIQFVVARVPCMSFAVAITNGRERERVPKSLGLSVRTYFVCERVFGVQSPAREATIGILLFP